VVIFSICVRVIHILRPDLIKLRGMQEKKVAAYLKYFVSLSAIIVVAFIFLRYAPRVWFGGVLSEVCVFQ